MVTYENSMIYSVADASCDERATFIRKTYAHLAGAIALFAILETLLIMSPISQSIVQVVHSGGRFGWLMFLGAFAVVGWMARSFASKVDSVPMQYLGLGVYVIAEAILFVPLIYIAVHYSAPSALPNAAILTGVLFLGLTAIAFTTRKDFTFLGGFLKIAGFMAIGVIVCAAIFGFNLGLLFSVIMVGIAGAAILYDTSKVMHHYSTDQHVAASLELFASVALLFWYILRIMMRFSKR